jgi:histone demethylase JARID1
MNWALGVRKCISKIEDFLKDGCSEKVNYVEIEELVAMKCAPCYEPSLTKLQVCHPGYICSLYLALK